MSNYQLKRTNVLLGGQMKYDLILNNDEISNFYITPISREVPFGLKVRDNLLNYEHHENIKDFHKQTSSSFYRDFVDPSLTSLYPLPTAPIKDTDDTYDVICRKQIESVYNKEYEILCPLWLEQINSGDDLCFEIQVFSKSNFLIQTKKFYLSEKIANYFTKYRY